MKEKQKMLDENDIEYGENWDNLNRAIDCLQEFNVPDKLPCRDIEKETIY